MRQKIDELKRFGQVEINISDYAHFVAMCNAWEGIFPQIAARSERKFTYLMTY